MLFIEGVCKVSPQWEAFGDTTETMAYLVEIKRSARRCNGPAGEWVVDYGPRRAFESKALAREWARQLRSPRASVWVQDAAPNDPSEVDGYLVGGRSRRRSGGSGVPGRQAELGAR